MLVFYNTLSLIPTVVACLQDNDNFNTFPPIHMKGKDRSSRLNLSWSMITLTNRIQRNWCCATSEARLYKAF